MAESLEQFLSRLREDGDLAEAGEEAICLGVVLPILAHLGWDWANMREVVPQYRIKDGRVDYCLKAGDRRVFVEVKQASERLEQHEEQLLSYAFHQGVEIAVLTSGLVWWLYLPLLKGSWDQRRFLAVDIQQQEIADAATHLTRYLSRATVADGSAVEQARALYESKEKERLIQETVPRAWQDLCNGPDVQLAELIADKVEGLCGHRPDGRAVKAFLLDLARPVELRPTAPLRPKEELERGRKGRWNRANAWNHRRPLAYTFGGQRRAVATFKELLLGLCTDLCKAHPGEVDRLLTAKTSSRARFSKDPRTVWSPVLIPGTRLYAAGTEHPNVARCLCAEALRVFGHSEDEFRVEFGDGRA